MSSKEMKEKFTEAGAKRAQDYDRKKPMEPINNGNKILAEFMDHKFYYYSNRSDMVEDKGRLKDLESWAKYHSNWNWLVPVVHKIFSLPIEETDSLVFQLADLNMAWNRKDITEIWESCVRFVTKYQKKE